MATSTFRPLFVILISFVAASGPSRTALAQESTSAPLAEELVNLMEELQIEAVAGRDPAEDDRFLAAMLASDRLLVVSARYSSPGTAQVKITNREFQEVYTDLDTTPVAGTKMLITDAGANGLRATPARRISIAEGDLNDAVDRGDHILRLDDDPSGQDLSGDEYRSAFVEADEQYARILELLIASARADSGDAPRAEEAGSAPLAAELSRIMTEQQLGAAANKDTVDDDRFVAVLAFPGQLLVVSARYSAPVLIETKLAEGQFREVYIDLNQAAIAGTKTQITDGGANGLRAADETIDVIDQGTGILRLDGNPAGQDLSRDEYQDAVAEADVHYTRMLRALLDSVR